MDTIDLLINSVKVPIQATTTDTKYPCTGFSYLVIKNKDKLCNLYIEGKEDEYYEFIKKLIIEAGNRKRDNKNIPENGEYIDQDTVKADFREIYDKLQFYELATVNDGIYGNIIINQIATYLFEIDIGEYIIINRSHETFVLLKISDDMYLVIDSHKSKHGLVTFENALNYITKNNKYEGTIQLAIVYK